MDIILFAKNPEERLLAEHIVEIFLSLKDKMKFVSVIYNGSEWNGSGLKFPHVDEEHKTHIHIQWGDAGVATAGFASDLEGHGILPNLAWRGS